MKNMESVGNIFKSRTARLENATVTRRAGIVARRVSS